MHDVRHLAYSMEHHRRSTGRVRAFLCGALAIELLHLVWRAL